MILVTGATGTIGGQVVRILAEQGVPYRAMSRKPGDLANSVQADFTDPVSLTAAVDGVDAVFLVTVPPRPSADHDLALIKAAKAAGVAKIVKLSAVGTGEVVDGAVVGEWHLEAEHALAASGLAWVALRPPSFASNFLWYRELINAGEPIPNMMGAAPQAIVDPRDVAAVAVAALTTNTLDGAAHNVTGPNPITFGEQATILERVLGRPVKTADLGMDGVHAQLSASGYDDAAIEVTTRGILWAQEGRASVVSDVVPQVLGRPASTFEQWATDHRGRFDAIQ